MRKRIMIVGAIRIQPNLLSLASKVKRRRICLLSHINIDKALKRGLYLKFTYEQPFRILL